MIMRFTLTEYIMEAMRQAAYTRLEDRTYCGRIPSCHGVIAFAGSLRDCEKELRSILEDWIVLGLKMGHRLPNIGGINLNQRPHREQLRSRVSGGSLSANFVTSDSMGRLQAQDTIL